MNIDKLKQSETTDGKPPRPGFETASAPAPIKANGQHEAYWVLSEEERKKGFIRPVRDAYIHVGMRPKYPLRDLTEEEKLRYSGEEYVKFETYPQGAQGCAIGRFWTEKELNSGCGTLTTMGRAIAETYAREPGYYGSTFCCHCGIHIRVGAQGEFVWADNFGKPTTERVGT